ncbi:MAG: peptide-methionine (R)-S-oxide reductase [Pseudomonadota bacterium]
MTSLRTNRRRFMTAAAASPFAFAASPALAQKGETEAFTYEIVRPDAEWRDRLTEFEYAILREGGTEKPRSSNLWNETRKGTYHCKGCGLLSYSSDWKVELDKGWVFFLHGEENAHLLGQDDTNPYGGGGGTADKLNVLIEVHCRRCGSHLGHLLRVDGLLVHCINGAALDFRPAEA